jgi:hypothetical protein
MQTRQGQLASESLQNIFASGQAGCIPSALLLQLLIVSNIQENIFYAAY